jgi:hypothetical protein
MAEINLKIFKMMVVKENPCRGAGTLFKEQQVSVIPGRSVNIKYRQQIGVLKAHCN